MKLFQITFFLVSSVCQKLSFLIDWSVRCVVFRCYEKRKNSGGDKTPFSYHQILVFLFVIRVGYKPLRLSSVSPASSKKWAAYAYSGANGGARDGRSRRRRHPRQPRPPTTPPARSRAPMTRSYQPPLPRPRRQSAALLLRAHPTAQARGRRRASPWAPPRGASRSCTGRGARTACWSSASVSSVAPRPTSARCSWSAWAASGASTGAPSASPAGTPTAQRSPSRSSTPTVARYRNCNAIPSLKNSTVSGLQHLI